MVLRRRETRLGDFVRILCSYTPASSTSGKGGTCMQDMPLQYYTCKQKHVYSIEGNQNPEPWNTHSLLCESIEMR